MKNPFKKLFGKIKTIIQKPKEKKKQKQKFKSLNKKLDKWDDFNADPNDVKSIKSNLKEFYKRNDLEPEDNERFDTSIKYTKEQMEELQQIADAAENKDINVEDWAWRFEGYEEELDPVSMKKFESNVGQYGIETFEDFVNFYENMNRWKNDKYLSFLLSSDQVAELFEYAGELGIEDPAQFVMETAFFEYSNSGMMKGDLYDFIRSELNQGYY